MKNPGASEPFMSKTELLVIENFLATLPAELSYTEAEALAEEEVRMSGLSRMAARALGAQLRDKFYRKSSLARIRGVIQANREAGRHIYEGLESHEIGQYNRKLMYGND